MKRKFVLSEVESMAKYVRMILRDITKAYADVVQCERRLEQTKCHRSSADYAVRRQHLDVIRQLDDAQTKLRLTSQELTDLGVVLLDQRHGVAGFPFRWSRNERSRRVRKALFLLKLHDDPDRGVSTWRFTGETEERRIPAHWLCQVSSPILSEVGFARER